jgi:hypothetical protein
MAKIQYWDRVDYYSSKSEIKRLETWEGSKEEIFKRFDKANNRLRYCNGSYYKFEDKTMDIEYNTWYKSLSKSVQMDMYYGNGVVD